jgi:hypothetical protein
MHLVFFVDGPGCVGGGGVNSPTQLSPNRILPVGIPRAGFRDACRVVHDVYEHRVLRTREQKHDTHRSTRIYERFT